MLSSQARRAQVSFADAACMPADRCNAVDDGLQVASYAAGPTREDGKAAYAGALPVASDCPEPSPPAVPHRVSAYDFIYNACAKGQQLKCLIVVDEFTQEYLATNVAGNIRSNCIIEVL